VQAIVADGGAAAAWVLCTESDHEPTRMVQAGPSTLPLPAVEDLGRAAISQKRFVSGVPSAPALVGAPLVHRGEILGALALLPPRSGFSPPRPGTTVVRLSGEAEVEDARHLHEFLGAAAQQLATAIANARLQEEARTTSARLAGLIAAAPDAVLVFDRSDRIVSYNARVLEILDLKDVDLTGWTPQDFMREVGPSYEDPTVPLEIARRAAEEKDRAHRIEFVLLRPKRRLIERVSTPILTAERAWCGQVVIYRDLSETRDPAARRFAMP
jgi:PAS domain-containing protein